MRAQMTECAWDAAAEIVARPHGCLTTEGERWEAHGQFFDIVLTALQRFRTALRVERDRLNPYRKKEGE